MRPAAIMMLTALAALGCSKSEAGSSGPAATGTGITISPGTTGGVSIQGAPPLSGDPAACAAFKACCPPGANTGPAGLACGLAPAAANGDCGKALESVRGIFKEQGITAPPGCNDAGGSGQGSGNGSGQGRNRRKVEGQHAP